MPYIGNNLATQFQAFATQTITGDGSTGYTLDRAVANGKELLVYINNVKQEEGSGKSYTASGTTITFSEAVASGDSCYLVYMGSAQQTVTAPDNSVTSAMLAKDASGNLTLDIAGDITLDADGGDIRLSDGGTQFGKLHRDGGDFKISSSENNEDIIFMGADGGLDITALTLDMSEGGRATFNDVVRIPTNLEHDGDADTFFGFPSADNFVITAGNVSRVYGSASETVINEDSGNLDFRVESDDDTHALFVDAGNNSLGLFTDGTNTALQKVNVGLTGTVISGNTDGATIGANGIFKLVDDSNWTSTDATIFLTGGGNGGSVTGQIMSAIGFSRESASHWGTQLRFYTHPADTADLDELKERMRIKAEGSLFLGENAPGAATPSGSQVGTAFAVGNYPYILNSVADASTRYHHQFFNSNGSVGIISTNGSNTTYATSSDYRLKENVNYTWDGTTELKKLKPCEFNFKVDNTKTLQGFIAHEVAEVVPNAVVGDKDEMKAVSYYEEGDALPTGKKIGDVKEEEIVVQSLDSSYLVPLLTKSLQEALARIDTLEAEVAKLKG